MKTLITCEGIKIDNFWLPPFQWQSGELLCLHPPFLCYSEEEKRLCKLLTGEQNLQGFQVLGRVIVAEPAAPLRGIFRLFQNPDVKHWFHRQKIPQEMVPPILQRLNIPAHSRLSSHAGTPRQLLGLEAAWACGAEGIIFNNAGLDPSGRQKVYQAVAKHLGQCGALHLSYAYWTQGHLERDCIPTARCLELQEITHAPVATGGR